MIRPFQLIAAGLCCSAMAYGQAPGQTAAPLRSHVERFSTPEMRAERVEREMNAKLAANPNDTEALNLRALARMRFGRYQEASDDLRRAVSLKPDNAAYRANFGYVLWKLGRADEAITMEREALRLDSNNFTAQYQLGRFLIRTGSRELLTEAVAHLRRALELDPQQYDIRFELIDAYRALGDRAQAATQLEFLADARPTDARVFYVSGLLNTDRDDLEAAIRDFKEAVRRDPSLFGAWQDLGLVYVKLKRWADAVEAFSEAADKQSDSVDAAYLHALSLFNSGRAPEAEREVRRALRLNAGAADAHTLLGVILASRGGANSEAREALSQAVALNPKSFDSHFYLARVLYAVKDYAGAVSELRIAAALNPQHEEARFFLGTALEAAGESDAAMTVYKDLVKLDAESAFGQLGLGALLVKQGKIDDAVAALNRAVALDPKSFEAHWALGRALFLSSRYSEAARALETAVSLAPYRADAHYQLGLALRRVGRTDEAAREFAAVDKLNAEFRTGAATRQ